MDESMNACFSGDQPSSADPPVATPSQGANTEDSSTNVHSGQSFSTEAQGNVSDPAQSAMYVQELMRMHHETFNAQLRELHRLIAVQKSMTNRDPLTGMPLPTNPAGVPLAGMLPQQHVLAPRQQAYPAGALAQSPMAYPGEAPKKKAAEHPLAPFFDHNPNPTKEELAEIAAQTGMTQSSVSKYFSARRSRVRSRAKKESGVPSDEEYTNQYEEDDDYIEFNAEEDDLLERRRELKGSSTKKDKGSSPPAGPSAIGKKKEDLKKDKKKVAVSEALRDILGASCKVSNPGVVKPVVAVMKQQTLWKEQAVVLAAFAESDPECLQKFVDVAGVTIINQWIQQAKSEINIEGLRSLTKFLIKLPITVEVLRDSMVGHTINKMKNSTDPELKDTVAKLMKAWTVLIKAAEGTKRKVEPEKSEQGVPKKAKVEGKSVPLKKDTASSAAPVKKEAPAAKLAPKPKEAPAFEGLFASIPSTAKKEEEPAKSTLKPDYMQTSRRRVVQTLEPEPEMPEGTAVTGSSPSVDAPKLGASPAASSPSPLGASTFQSTSPGSVTTPSPLPSKPKAAPVSKPMSADDIRKQKQKEKLLRDAGFTTKPAESPLNLTLESPSQQPQSLQSSQEGSPFHDAPLYQQPSSFMEDAFPTHAAPSTSGASSPPMDITEPFMAQPPQESYPAPPEAMDTSFTAPPPPPALPSPVAPVLPPLFPPKKGKKRVSWASEGDLCKIKEFSKEPEYVVEMQAQEPAPLPTHLSHDFSTERKLEAQLFNRERQERKHRLEAMCATTSWTEPKMLELPEDVPDSFGDDSTEKETQRQRESVVLVTIYLSKNDIPPSPAEPDPSTVTEHDDMLTPIIPTVDKSQQAPPQPSAPLPAESILAGLVSLLQGQAGGPPQQQGPPPMMPQNGHMWNAPPGPPPPFQQGPQNFPPGREPLGPPGPHLHPDRASAYSGSGFNKQHDFRGGEPHQDDRRGGGASQPRGRGKLQKPCMFWNPRTKTGCRNGNDCPFLHVDEEEERREGKRW